VGTKSFLHPSFLRHLHLGSRALASLVQCRQAAAMAPQAEAGSPSPWGAPVWNSVEMSCHAMDSSVVLWRQMEMQMSVD